jgi:cyanate permease
VLLGLMVMVVAIPVAGLFLKETPQMMGLWPDGETAARARVAKQSGQEPGLCGSEAWHTATFWLIAGAFFLMSVSVHGCLIHLVPMLTDRGISAESAALATSLLGGALLVGRVGAGYLLDRFFASHVAICFLCGVTLGILLLWTEAVGGLVFSAAVLVGLGVGAETDLMPYVVSRYFGLRAFGEIYGYVVVGWGLGGVIGPLVMGMGFDSTGSYGLVLGMLMVATVMAAGLMARLGPYRTWAAAAEAA